MATENILFENRSFAYLSDGTLKYRPDNEGTALRWLFIDNEGVIKSATGQTLACKANINARACGVDVQSCLIPVSLQLVNWAQKIIFLDQWSYDKFSFVFREYEMDLRSAQGKSVVLNLTDTYFYMQPQLVGALKEALPELTYNG
jgi:predicted protein tyrosine phosphatase